SHIVTILYIYLFNKLSKNQIILNMS
ncbi:hypothetical protein, partial [Plasmodium yoelii yoelii]